MHTTLNLPVQLIASCSTLGDFTPLRFRYENAEHRLITVSIDDILSTKEIHYNGMDEIIYTCYGTLEQESRLFTLKYNIRSHRWLIFQLLT